MVASKAIGVSKEFEERSMNLKEKGRLAGGIYLMLVLTGIFNLIYVPSKLIVWSDASATVANISEFNFLFRAGITVGIISYVIYLLLPLVFFDIFKNVNRRFAVLMVALAVVSVPVSLFNMVDKVNVLTLLSDANYLSTLSAEQIQTKVMLLLKSYSNGIAVVQIFWGLWLFPLGYLIFKSAYLPRILGILLMLGCFGYLTRFFAHFLFPEVDIPSIVSKPASIGEIGTCVWLLIMGIKEKRNKINAEIETK